MNIRMKFKKYGCMKFIGHLDIMRFFQKAIRRADIDIAYSEGFSPHMIMSFAAPLGVGLTSEGEYVDLQVNSCTSSNAAVEALNQVMVEGVEVISFLRLPDTAKNAMSSVAAADYFVKFLEGYEPAGWRRKFDDFLAQKEIVILKKTKKSEAEVDLKPMIYECRLQENGIFMKTATGSVNNLKPELVMEAFAKFAGFELEKFSLEIARLEVYADLGDETEKKLVPLEELGEKIES
ncbi:MAG: TIGR03936 family radical SAM-associated protein [Lachnospiraceae bacterium]